MEFICSECRQNITNQNEAVSVVDKGYICDGCLEKEERSDIKRRKYG